MTEAKAKDNVTKIDLEGLIASKNPRLLKFIPGFILRKIKRIIHQNEINKYLKDNANSDPYTFVENGLKMFGAKITIKGQENLPANKRNLFVANHPLGGLDGLVFIKVIHDIYGELRFPVNDLLLNLPNMKGVFLPINKHGGHTREAFRSIEEAYQSDLPVCYFPAGLCSRKIKGQIQDLDWKKSIISAAIKYQRDIIPVHIDGENSNFFYNLSNIRMSLGIKANIEMLYLVDEMYSQYDKSITISFGKPISWEKFDKSKSLQEWTQFVREKTYEMA